MNTYVIIEFLIYLNIFDVIRTQTVTNVNNTTLLSGNQSIDSQTTTQTPNTSIDSALNQTTVQTEENTNLEHNSNKPNETHNQSVNEGSTTSFNFIQLHLTTLSSNENNTNNSQLNDETLQSDKNRFENTEQNETSLLANTSSSVSNSSETNYNFTQSTIQELANVSNTNTFFNQTVSTPKTDQIQNVTSSQLNETIISDNIRNVSTEYTISDSSISDDSQNLSPNISVNNDKVNETNHSPEPITSSSNILNETQSTTNASNYFLMDTMSNSTTNYLTMSTNISDLNQTIVTENPSIIQTNSSIISYTSFFPFNQTNTTEDTNVTNQSNYTTIIDTLESNFTNSNPMANVTESGNTTDVTLTESNIHNDTNTAITESSIFPTNISTESVENNTSTHHLMSEKMDTKQNTSDDIMPINSTSESPNFELNNNITQTNLTSELFATTPESLNSTTQSSFSTDNSSKVLTTENVSDDTFLNSSLTVNATTVTAAKEITTHSHISNDSIQTTISQTSSHSDSFPATTSSITTLSDMTHNISSSAKPSTTSYPNEPNISSINVTFPNIKNVNHIGKQDMVNIVTITFISKAIDIFRWTAIFDVKFRNFVCNVIDPEKSWCTINRVNYVSPSPLIMDNHLIINFFIDISTENDLNHVFSGPVTVETIKNSTNVLEKIMGMKVMSLQTNLGTMVVKPLESNNERLAKFELLVFIFTVVMFICTVLLCLAIICSCAKRKSIDMNQIELYNTNNRQIGTTNGGLDLNSASNILRDENNHKRQTNVIKMDDGWVAPIDQVIENEKFSKYDNLQDTKL